jgi:phosphonate transport system substrate-binding protein
MKKNVKKLIVVFVMAGAMLAGAAFSGSNPPDWPAKLVFGIIPTDSSSNITERTQNLVEYLEKRLGLPITVKVTTDYAGVIAGMQFKHVDFAYFGPKSYVEASRRANAEAFAIEVSEDGTTGYYGLIITKKGSGLNSMTDIKGKTWAFTDPNSTSGTLVPSVYFYKELQVAPEKYFSKVIYSGSHAASMIAVRSGKVDAASTNDLDMARGEGKTWNSAQDFNIIWKSKLIPGSPMAYRKDLPASLKNKLKEVFLAYKDPVGLQMLKIKGYEDGDDSVYDPIRDLIEVKAKMVAKK